MVISYQNLSYCRNFHAIFKVARVGLSWVAAGICYCQCSPNGSYRNGVCRALWAVATPFYLITMVKGLTGLLVSATSLDNECCIRENDLRFQLGKISIQLQNRVHNSFFSWKWYFEMLKWPFAKSCLKGILRGYCFQNTLCIVVCLLLLTTKLTCRYTVVASK